MREGFSRQAREIGEVPVGKDPLRQAFNGCEYRF